ncbi:unnamed protein product, partial [Sphagnum tenellum]
MRNLRTFYATTGLGFKTGYLLKGRRQQKAVGMDCMVPNKHPQQDPEYEQKMKSQSSYHSLSDQESTRAPSRYEAQKRRDWNTFGQYLRNHRPPLPLARCTGTHVLDFVRYLDQFGKTKVHLPTCPYYGLPQPPHPCSCPLRQAWGSLDALIGRLRAAFEENGGKPESNPFGARTVRMYLREVREMQAKARGIAYGKKKRKRPPPGSSDHHALS